MGDLIEGTDGMGETSFRATTRPHNEKAPLFPVGPLRSFLIWALLVVVALTGVMFVMERDAKAFAAKMSNRCFETNASARGSVETTFGKSVVVMIFPSGSRENYAIDSLKEISCGELNLPTESEHNGS